MNITESEVISRMEQVQSIIDVIPFAPQVDFLIMTTQESVASREMTRGVRPYRSVKMRVGMVIDVPLALKKLGNNTGYIPGMYVVYDEEQAVDYSWWSYPTPGPSPAPDPDAVFVTDYNVGECCFNGITANNFLESQEFPPNPPEPGGEYPLSFHGFSTAVFSYIIAHEFVAETEPVMPTTYLGNILHWDRWEDALVIFGKLRSTSFNVVEDQPHPPIIPNTPEPEREKEPDWRKKIHRISDDDTWVPELKMVRPGGILCRELGAGPLAFSMISNPPIHPQEPDVDEEEPVDVPQWKENYHYKFL